MTGPTTSGSYPIPMPRCARPDRERAASSLGTTRVKAALVALHRWIETGIPAPSAPFIERVGPEPTDASQKLSRDLDGDTIGGLRSPIVTVPVAAYDGEACIQAGTTVPLSTERLAGLYPTHETYIRRLLTATDQAVDDGFLLCADAERIMRGASASTIGGLDRVHCDAGVLQAVMTIAPPPLRRRSSRFTLA